MHMHQLYTLYQSNGSKNSPGVIWGHRSQKVTFQNVPIELKLDWKYACDILTMIKHMLRYSMTLSGLKGVQKSKFSKCSNSAQTLLKVCVCHLGCDILTTIKHTLCYKLSLRDHKGVWKSKLTKYSNWAETWLKYTCDILTMINHTLCRGSKVKIVKML